MIMEKIMSLAFLLLVMGSCRCLAQSGYNYARPEVTSPSAASSSPLRPIVPIGNTGTGTATAATAPTYPTTATGYSGPATAAAASPFGAYNPASAAAAFTGITPASLAKRPVLQSRPGASGIYAGGPQQFGSTARAGGGAVAPSNNALDNDYDGDYSAIPGVPAVDYPVYAQVPRTNFDCAQQLPGYYSDVEAQCQVFHICALNRTYSFLCPNGTIFSQETLVCVWWNQFDCGTAPSLYANNAYIYDYSKEGVVAGGGTTQIGIGTGSRTATNYVGAGNVGGTRNTASTLPTASIYNPGNLRANVYASVPTAVSGLAGANFGQGENAAVGRFMTASTQTYNAPATAVTPASYSSSVLRGSGGSSLPGGGGGLGGNFPSAQVSTTSTNREYLPPRRP